MKNKPSLRLLTQEGQQIVNAGHLSTASTIGIIIGILELPHIFMGLREFTNYVVGLYQGNEVEEDDYFTHFFFG